MPTPQYITVPAAAALAGCTTGYLRQLLAAGKLKGWKAGERAWMVDRSAAEALASTLTTRSNGRKSERLAKKTK